MSAPYTTYAYRILIIILILGLSAAVVYRYVDAALAEVQAAVGAELEATESRAESLATTAALAITQPAYAPLIETCPADTQARFDTTLNSLGSGLSPSDLEFLGVYFDRCAGQFARTQVLTGAALTDTVTQLDRWQTVHQLLQDDAAETIPVATWQALAEAEVVLGTLQTDLVEAQRELVLARLAGEAVTSPRITATLEAVEATRASTTKARETRNRHFDELGL